MSRLASLAFAATLALLPAIAQDPAAPSEAAPAADSAPAAEPAPAATTEPPAKLTLLPISTTRPKMPDAACQQRIAGWVELTFAILPDGKVAQIEIVGSQPAGVFDEAARQAIAERIYAPQQLPVGMRERLVLGPGDCQAAQLKPPAPAEGGAPSQEDCPAIAADARKKGDAIAAAEASRAAISDGTQVYSAPAGHCIVAGRKLKPGTSLFAYFEYQAFSLVGRPKAKEDSWVWVPSNQLKDTTPIP